MTPTEQLSERLLKLSISSIVEVLPTSTEQRVPAVRFLVSAAPDAIKEFWEIGKQTQLYRHELSSIVAGDALPKLLAALEARDYLEVNRLFRAVPSYDRVLRAAQETGRFPSRGLAGADDNPFAATLAVPIGRVLDAVCREKRISPIRFEALLARTLGRRGLRDFEAQRALSNTDIPTHRSWSPPRPTRLLGARRGSA